MDLSRFPLHVVDLIICKYLEDTSLASSLRLRLVSRVFNREVLHAFFNLQAPRFRERWPYGQILPFDSLAMVRYLQGLATRSKFSFKGDAKGGHWLHTIEHGAKVLQRLMPDHHSIALLHEREVAVEGRGAAEWVYRRVMCEAIVSFLGPAECFASIVCDELSSSMGTPHLCILNRPASFWVVVAACHLGSCSAVEQAIVMLRQTFPEDLDWRIHLNGCMFVAARSGHANVVRLLIDMGLDVNGRAYRGFNRFIGGDGTPLCGAARFGCLDTVELMLKQNVVRERQTYEWALYQCVKHRDKIDIRGTILKRLLQEGEGIYGTLCVHQTLLSRASRVNNHEMTKVILDHISSRVQSVDT